MNPHHHTLSSTEFEAMFRDSEGSINLTSDIRIQDSVSLSHEFLDNKPLSIDGGTFSHEIRFSRFKSSKAFRREWGLFLRYGAYLGGIRVADCSGDMVCISNVRTSRIEFSGEEGCRFKTVVIDNVSGLAEIDLSGLKVMQLLIATKSPCGALRLTNGARGQDAPFRFSRFDAPAIETDDPVHAIQFRYGAQHAHVLLDTETAAKILNNELPTIRCQNVA